jgi:hypothetical protein
VGVPQTRSITTAVKDSFTVPISHERSMSCNLSPEAKHV